MTICVGLDTKTAPFFMAAAPTWFCMHPWLADCPWLIFHDVEASDLAKEASLLVMAYGGKGLLTPWQPSIEYPTQRAKMLTGWLHVPPDCVKTDWWMKIDADAVCQEKHDWPNEDWFSGEHVIVASRWGYSKPKGSANNSPTHWIEQLESFGDRAYPGTGRIADGWRVNGRRIHHERFASWLSFYRTDWTRDLKTRLIAACGIDNAPVPSQDTVAWYAAERSGAKYLLRNQKRFGWTNVSKLHSLRKLVTRFHEQL